VRRQDRQQPACVARQRRLEDLAVLAPRLLAREIAHLEGEHAVAQALVVHHAMEGEQPARAARGNQRRVELAVIAFEQRPIALGVAVDHLLDLRELVIGGDQPRFPVEVGARDRQLDRAAFEHAAHLGDVAQIAERRRHHGETALALVGDQPF
jgi:hypothetical protein